MFVVDFEQVNVSWVNSKMSSFFIHHHHIKTHSSLIVTLKVFFVWLCFIINDMVILFMIASVQFLNFFSFLKLYFPAKLTCLSLMKWFPDFNAMYPANIYLFKVNNRSTGKRCEICSKLTIKTQEQSRSGVFMVNFEHISHLFLVFLLMTLNN